MTDNPVDDLNNPDLLAAEYVLGSLDLASRTQVESRIARDPAFAAQILAWQNRLSGLNDDYAEVAAPNLMPAIEARLFPQAPRRSWRQALIGFGLAATAAIAVAVVMLQPVPPTMTASLTADASPLHYSAAIAGDQLTLTRTAGTDAEAGKDYELWIIPPNQAPISLGILHGDSITLPAPAALTGYVLAVTLEPKGGGPDGKPTGPILAAGPLTNI
jgi:anti-sigma-K factor RskA